MIKNIIYVSVLTLFLTQILFSFFFSQEIINQNNTINKNSKTLTDLQNNYQQLQKKYLQITELSTLKTKIDALGLQPITKTLNINGQ